MSQSEVERFVRDIRTSATLQAEVGKEGSLEAVVAVGASHGYGFTAQDATAFVKAKSKAGTGQLSEADLDKVAGGGAWYSIFSNLHC